MTLTEVQRVSKKENGQQECNQQDSTIDDAEKPRVYRNYKDRVFRLLFNNKGRLLELYNALSGKDYADAE